GVWNDTVHSIVDLIPSLENPLPTEAFTHTRIFGKLCSMQQNGTSRLYQKSMYRVIAWPPWLPIRNCLPARNPSSLTLGQPLPNGMAMASSRCSLRTP